jgi:hypothetical protein
MGGLSIVNDCIPDAESALLDCPADFSGVSTCAPVHNIRIDINIINIHGFSEIMLNASSSSTNL